MLFCVLASFAASAQATQTLAIDGDLRTTAGDRVATLSGSVNRAGRGYGDLAPLGRASSVGLRRGERVRLLRREDGSIAVLGGLGTRLTLRAVAGSAVISGDGWLALAPDAARSRYVSFGGVASARPFAPRPGQTLVVLGHPSGPLRDALARRYRLVRYRSHWARDALLADPERYAKVAGVLIGSGVSARQMRTLDLPIALYNSGRWVAATALPAAFDRAMRRVIHAHVGPGGAIVRRPNSAPGSTTHRHVQIRQPRFARIRLGNLRSLPSRPTPAGLRTAVTAAASHLDEALAREERSGTARTITSRQGAPGYAIVPSKPNLAYYTVSVDQEIVVDLSAPSAFGTGIATATCPSGGCAVTTLNQTIDLVFTPQYTVSVDQEGQQTITESSSTAANTIVPASGALGAGIYNGTTNLVTPGGVWGLYAMANVFNDPVFFGTAYGNPGASQTGLGLLKGYHSVVMGVSDGTAAVPVQFNASRSAPTQQVTQVGGNWSSGTDWEQSTTSSSTWSISGTLGIGAGSPSGITGGYSHETDNTTSNGGSLSASVSYTLSNWTTNPVQQNTPSPSNPSAQAAYSTFSSTIAGAGGLASPAASSLQYPTSIDVPNGGLIAAPSGYGGNGSGPMCGDGGRGGTVTPSTQVAAWTCYLMTQPTTYGSGMNVTGYQQGSVSSFGVMPTGSANQTPGTAQPLVVDNFLYAETIAPPAGQTMFGPTAMQFTELQVIGQSDVVGAQLMPGNRSATALTASETNPTATGSGPSAGITTYFGSQGQQLPGAESGTYSTIGLDLCAPPVLTVELWQDGCSGDFVQEPPATVYGAGPAIAAVAPGTLQQSSGQPFAVQGTTLQCSAGTWSGAPSYVFQWQQWNANTSGWVPLEGAAQQSFTPQSPGYFLCSVAASNADGTVSSSSMSVQIVSPAPSAPGISSIAPASVSVNGGQSIVITGVGFTGATGVTIGGSSVTSFTVDSDTQITAIVPAGTPGVAAVAVTTPAGSTTAGTGITYVTPPPVIGALQPSSGATAGGSSVVITGSGFTGATAVTFGGVAAAAFAVVSDTEISATTPAGAAGAVAVAVTTPGGTSTLANGFTYVAGAPTVTAIAPAAGSADGGTAVTITGTALTGATAVTFDGTAAASFTIDSATQISAVTPAHGPGRIQVLVTTSGGSALGRFTYTAAAPTVSAVAPASGSTLGGAAISLTGTGFAGATSVAFGGIPAASFSVLSGTSISAVAPAGAAGVVDVTVTSPAGTGTASQAFTFVAPPAPAAIPSAVVSTATLSAAGQVIPVSITSPGVVAAPINCAVTNAVLSTCSASLAGRSPGTAFGASLARSVGGSAVTIAVPLTRAARAQLRQSGRTSATLVLTATTSSGAAVSSTSTVTLSVPRRLESPAGTLFTASGSLAAAGRTFAATVASILPPKPAALTCAGYQGGVRSSATAIRLGKVRASSLCAALRANGISPSKTILTWLLAGGARTASGSVSSPAAITLG